MRIKRLSRRAVAKNNPVDEKNGGRACKPDSVRRTIRESEPHTAAIIPLGHGSHRDSSSLPESYPSAMACAIATGARFRRKRAHRAGPALPSYLALHHAGFSVPPVSPPERWALTPPFHPCQTLRAFRRRPAGFPAGCHRARLAGGLFSVALSVTQL